MFQIQAKHADLHQAYKDTQDKLREVCTFS